MEVFFDGDGGAATGPGVGDGGAGRCGRVGPFTVGRDWGGGFGVFSDDLADSVDVGRSGASLEVVDGGGGGGGGLAGVVSSLDRLELRTVSDNWVVSVAPTFKTLITPLSLISSCTSFSGSAGLTVEMSSLLTCVASSWSFLLA